MTATTAPDADPTLAAAAHRAHLEAEHKKYFTFINLSLALIAVTAVELVIVYIPIHPLIIFTALIALSTAKFIGVIWWFMHLAYDKKLCTALFMVGLVLATGTLFALLLLFPEAEGGVPEGFF